ncbi:MAG TPA: POTRA domain-containing protein [Polyangiaceae bacterium]|nr:POTRA domain-containing protein [Polyangiaceae bacterium]
MLRWATLLVVVLGACFAHAAPPPGERPASGAAPAAQTTPGGAGSEENANKTLELAPPSSLGRLEGRIIRAIEITVLGNRWVQPVQLKTVRVGERATTALARRAARELTDTGRYARASVSAEELGDGVVLKLSVLPRRLIASVSVEGAHLEEDALLAEAHIAVGGEVTVVTLPQMSARLVALHRERGYRRAAANIDVRETDDPMQVALVVRIDPGPKSTVTRRTFVRDGVAYAPDPVLDAELDALARSYAVGEGQTVDEESLAAADRALTEAMRGAQYSRATVQHQIVVQEPYTFLYVRIDPGPKFVRRYAGLLRFDADDLERALEIDKELDRSVRRLGSKITDFYARRGFLDVEVDAEERGGSGDRVHVLFFAVREHSQVKVVSREFPCLSGGPLSVVDATRDIDSFLEEELPGSGLFGSVDAAGVDALHGPTTSTGTRVLPLELEPRATYVAETYDRALKHLQDYYRSQGYLSAAVGPLQLVRRQCDRHSPPNGCLPLNPPVRVQSACVYDAEGLPLEEPAPDRRLLCVPDPKMGIFCEPGMRMRIPVKLGPRTTLYDIAFEGNKMLVEQDLAEKAELELGSPVSQTALEAARRRVLDAFKEEGFAFAEVRTVLDYSGDRTRGRARFIISESERVYVDGIVVRGLKRTNPALVARRMSLTRCGRDRPVDQCEPFRTSDVRKSEERIATLGTFSSVSISLEDPQVPAKRKVVIVEVQERITQYLEPRAGFSTGDGVRGTLEYGHRNLGGQAIQFTFRTQLNYLPDAFIIDEDVKENYRDLAIAERLERRNTASLVFPEIGLGPLVRLGVDGIDVRDNARDFGLTKDAAIATVTYRPARTVYAQLGGSLERNDVDIFRGGTIDAYLADVARRGGSTLDLSRLLRVPTGLSFAVAERVSATWDRRDNPFGATRGTQLVAGVEHVHAFRAGAVPGVCSVEPKPGEVVPDACPSDFLRLTGTASGYVRLTEGGMAIAVSVRAGRIQQLIINSKTYPDRLFFLGGVDSMRGFLADSLVPEDIAQEIINPTNPQNRLTIQDVRIRGGDVFINPRLELRIPVSGVWEWGIFLDTGNVWVEPQNFNPFALRYAAGAGIRVGTPIGPIAFDYGINLIRREWEDRGNFHFSIGLF